MLGWKWVLCYLQILHLLNHIKIEIRFIFSVDLFGFDNKSLKSIENSLANNFARIFKRGKSCARIILSQHLGLSSRNLDQSGRFFKIKNSWKRFFKIYQIPWFSQAVIEIIYKSFFFQTFIFLFFLLKIEIDLSR